ncbi:unnamed protein product [Protopolystoma xenopodis]|uniref:Uncharacterized protein n=1 Tax=Protopolystoma xenopodis TaxID=117903 RepID=A0A3S5CP53_9PLAT|nr:unnamed protein product [Protopolystoma xenopodis]
MIGPALSNQYEFADTENVLRLSYGAAENVFFELGYNLQLLLYLRGDGYLTEAVRERGLAYCSVVLQRGFSYYNVKEGAFANFRDSLNKFSHPEGTAGSTSPTSYQQPQRRLNHDSAACKLDTLATPLHCHECSWVKGQM